MPFTLSSGRMNSKINSNYFQLVVLYKYNVNNEGTLCTTTPPALT